MLGCHPHDNSINRFITSTIFIHKISQKLSVKLEVRFDLGDRRNSESGIEINARNTICGNINVEFNIFSKSWTR